MKIEYPVLLTENSVLILKGGKRLFAHSNHPCFNQIKDAIRRGAFANIERLFNLKKTVEKCFKIEIRNGSAIFYKNKPVNNILADKILNAIRENLPYKPWVKFLNNLMENPSDYCRDQLFAYVERYGLPIDSNGFVYSWKAVNSKLRDKYSNTLSYAPGRTIEMKREDCEQDTTKGCAPALHCGAPSYVVAYGQDAGDRFVLVKFNPKHVVACPTDSQWQKLRVHKLKSVREVKREEVQPLADNYIGARKKKNK